ncbi:hypothetical protein B0J18DRAFT_363464 [Chaetomium sp. MPI-SDFR-AT-0129]|nr:hypothetical protein B0J18DRAFT_363464 [Chaetomium sp. MPI-SDFR-AT-0129]
MDGTYGTVFPTSKAMSVAPSSNDGNQYKVNVSRQKTKKWANFKPQNYDGDDWGDEYGDQDDDDADDQPPAPPPKPLGPRFPTGNNSPTSRQFQPTGSPPVRTFQQQHPAPSLAGLPVRSQTASPPSVPISGPPRRTGTDPYSSSPRNSPGYSRPPFSPDGRRGGSPAPQGGHQLPSQLSSRENTMPDLDGGAGALDAMRQANASPRSIDRSEARSGSPSIAGASAPASASASAPGGTKPPAFVRPADLYRRMGEEAGRSGAGPVGGPLNETVGASGATAVDALEQKQNQGQGQDRGEGQGEVTYHDEQSKSVQPVSFGDIRRYSTSPQLPDLSRMSAFGEDLFSSTFFPGSGLRSPLSGSLQSPSSGDCIPEADETATTEEPAKGLVQATEATDTGATTGTTNAGEPAAAPSPPNQPNQDGPIGLPLHQDATQAALGAPEPPKPDTADAAREPTSSTETQQTVPQPTRPQLPGGWVTETPSTPGDFSAPAPLDPSSTEISDETAKSQDALAAAVAAAAPAITGSSQDATSAADGASDNNAPTALHSDSPRDLPVSTSSPAPNVTNEEMGPPQTSPEATRHLASPSLDVETTKPGSPGPATGSTGHSEITPTAPLNTRRSTPENPPSRLSPPLPADSTTDSSNNSPVKDSDLLSEEIMKSLSPGQPSTSAFTNIAEDPAAAYHAAASTDPTRESSYLGDVYGDYWSTTEDKVEPGLLLPGAGGEVPDVPPIPTEVVKGDNAVEAPSDSAPGGPSDAQSGSVLGDSTLQKRFSWEGLSQAAAASKAPPAAGPPTEQKALGSGLDNVVNIESVPGAPEVNPLQSSSAREAEKSAEDLRAESAPEFNPAATLGASLGLNKHDRSTSLGSDSSNEPSNAKRLSLAEEKEVLQDSSHPVSASPPLEQHPAFARDSDQQHSGLQPVGPAPGSSRGGTGNGNANNLAAPANIINFRNIMEMTLASDRIRLYNETRTQFAALESGLGEWVQVMTSAHPEHAEGVLMAHAAAAAPWHDGTAAGLSGLGGRGPALHIPQHLQHGLSGLGRSGNQAGTKSKELLMAAGKAGKGLFSKGRNKLRGTGGGV